MLRPAPASPLVARDACPPPILGTGVFGQELRMFCKTPCAPGQSTRPDFLWLGSACEWIPGQRFQEATRGEWSRERDRRGRLS